MGIYSNLLAPPNFGFWVILVLGIIGIATPFGDSYNLTTNQKRGRIAFSVFSFIATLTIIYLFGDDRVFSWLYERPRTSENNFTEPFGPVFWIITFLEVGLLAKFVRGKNGLSALTSVFITLLSLQLITGVPIFPIIVENWFLSIVLFFVSLGIGTIWFLYKWDSFAKLHRVKYDEIFQNWIDSKGLSLSLAGNLSLSQKSEFEKYFEKNRYTDDDFFVEYRPKYRDHKNELITWLIFWPISMLESVLFDFIAELFNHIYKRFGKVLENIMLKRWQGTENHMLTKEEREELLEQAKRMEDSSDSVQLKRIK